MNMSVMVCVHVQAHIVGEEYWCFHYKCAQTVNLSGI